MHRTLTLLLLALAAPAAFAAGGESAYAPCVACHGADGEGNPALNAPALAGQDAAYLARQLNNFRNGLRGADAKDADGAQMRPMAAVLSSEQAVADVAAYIAAMPAVPSPEEPAGDLRNGENQYNAACGACHGATAQGNPALNSPRLAGLDSAYLKRQYRNFGNGVRGADPGDRLGRQMAMMATMLASEKDLDDVIAFIHASSRTE
jgi:cytochrome c oxidase subunit 2